MLQKLVTKERLIELLYHPYQRIREDTLDALGNFFPGEKRIIGHILNVCSKYDTSHLHLVSGISSFIPTKHEFYRFIEFTKQHSRKEKQDVNILYHLYTALQKFPFLFIDQQSHLFQGDEDLEKLHRYAKFQEEIRSEEPLPLWKKLKEVCDKYEESTSDDRDDSDYVYSRFYIEGLARHPEYATPLVLEYLSYDEPESYNMEECCVEIAGKLRLNEAIPFLFRIFNHTDSMHIVNGKCLNALSAIGNEEIVQRIENSFTNDNENRNGLAEILGKIPYEYSEAAALRLLEKEKDKTTKAFLACSLCDIFSIKAKDMLIKLIENENYDPQVFHLSAHLISVFEYHKTEFPRHLEKIDREFQERMTEIDPVFRRIEEFKKTHNHHKDEQSGDTDKMEYTIEEKKKIIMKFKKNLRKKNK